jgi:hypothetical protein
MVLENTSPPPDSFSDSPYPSDRDPYSSDASPASQPGRSISGNNSNSNTTSGIAIPPIDMSTLPKPMPILGPLLGHTQASQARRTREFVGIFANMAQRPLTADETAALAQHGAKMRATSSWGDGLGLLAGGVRAYQTAGTFKFPLRKPSGRLDPDVLGPLRGGVARVGWHVLRFGAYGLLGNLVVGLLVSNYALAVAMVGIKQDGRLKGMQETIDRNKREMVRRERARRGLPPPAGEGQAQDGRRILESNAEGLDERAMAQRGFDEASPTGGGGSSWDAPYASQGTSTDSMASAQQTRAQPRPPWARPAPQARTTPQKEQSTSPFDPDSPTGGFGVFEDEQERPKQMQRGKPSRGPSTGAMSGGEGGSAWDRVRRQAVESGEARAGRETGRGEAQKDFDDRIERERRGEDFGGDEKRW